MYNISHKYIIFYCLVIHVSNEARCIKNVIMTSNLSLEVLITIYIESLIRRSVGLLKTTTSLYKTCENLKAI